MYCDDDEENEREREREKNGRWHVRRLGNVFVIAHHK